MAAKRSRRSCRVIRETRNAVQIGQHTERPAESRRWLTRIRAKYHRQQARIPGVWSQRELWSAPWSKRIAPEFPSGTGLRVEVRTRNSSRAFPLSTPFLLHAQVD